MGFISLGCAKNRVDTEIMLGLVQQAGYSIVNRAEEADVVVINTCGFIAPAKEEAIDTILETAMLKETGQVKHLVATGCLAQRYGRELLEEIPELDAVVGVSDFTRIAAVLDGLRAGHRRCWVRELPPVFREKGPRVLTTPPGWAYLKIAEGCDNRCSYCAIPAIRGGLRSRPVGELVAEAEWLATKGVRELVLVAQDTTMYGQDLYGRPSLPGLLQELARVEGIEWIRVMYTHPARIAPELIEVLALEDKVLPYLDMPVQHAADGVLRRMGRGYRGEEVLDLISNLRREVPDLALRTTVMVGFPGESEADFATLCDFVTAARFDWLGAFAYCREEGTAAASWDDVPDEATREARKSRILEIQRAITLTRNRARLGKSEAVLVVAGDGSGGFWGRCRFQAPEVDGITYLQSPRLLEPGQLLEARLVGARAYDLVGEVRE